MLIIQGVYNTAKMFVMQKDTKKIKKFIAFSLVELMISLITISCIAAAFTPIITKRLSKSSSGVGSGNNLLSDCASSKVVPGGDMCQLCYPGECVVCIRKCLSNQYLNQKTCLCENCKDKVENCTRCNENGCYGCAAGYYCPDDNGKGNCTSCRSCTTGMCCPEGSTAPVTCEHSFTQMAYP